MPSAYPLSLDFLLKNCGTKCVCNPYACISSKGGKSDRKKRQFFTLCLTSYRVSNSAHFLSWLSRYTFMVDSTHYLKLKQCSKGLSSTGSMSPPRDAGANANGISKTL